MGTLCYELCKTAVLIEMQFGMLVQVGAGNDVLAGTHS